MKKLVLLIAIMSLGACEGYSKQKMMDLGMSEEAAEAQIDYETRMSYIVPMLIMIGLLGATLNNGGLSGGGTTPSGGGTTPAGF